MIYMASSIIHMCVAKKVNETLNILDENSLLLGSIAPDISKHIGKDKKKSHFLTSANSIDINKFLKKYKTKLQDPFIMGYFIHLYTDLLWDKYFISEIVENGTIQLLDGTKVANTPEVYQEMIYNDYTNLNILLIDYYHLDLSLFFNEVVVPNTKMDEIPVEQLSKLIDYTGIIIANSKEQKSYTFKLDNILPFIEISSCLILSIIENISLY